MMNSKEKQSKIETYEDFIENILKSDLKEIERNLEEKSKSLKDWNDVKRIVKLYRLHNETSEDYLKIYNRLLKLDSYELFAPAEITITDKIFVKIGCDCLLEMDLEEADKYANIRIRAIEKQIAHFRKLAVNVKANIKVVLLAINELNING